ncbi:protein Lines homolog 1 isoform X2 [Anoplopoma fimbria]|uniref:protein Lines homolog 1 isoform X2 n=1 Tax=Anoplopoma fimbria TaxID=229290 RepID=UPI0023ECB03B|nr:protein Lines homolog 1 isoform X2 [Anoplopoma fimbria]
MAGPPGRGGIMEGSPSSRDLTDVSRCLVTGSRPSQSAADVAGLLFSGVRGLVPRPPSESGDLTCISLTLVDRITSDLTSRSLSPALTPYCGDILTGLFQDMDLMSQLGTISPVWQQKCVQAFHSSTPGPELDACLWSLTEVLKRLLKGAHRDVVGTLLAALDSSLSALCSKFLPEDRKEGTVERLADVTSSSSRRRGTTLCLLLDLLEVLTASSLICGAGVCLRSQRMTHIHSSALLTAVSCSSQYFVKKRALLLLKRAVLQKAGEDWALGEDPPPTGLRHEHFRSDANMLARSVLTAVAADWLRSVQVKSASFFGGTRQVRGEEAPKPDCVMLRAVSLLLLKSMELCVQTAGATGVDGASEVSGCLQSLWVFLRRCSIQLTEDTHRCCWLSLLFGDQDDDMMEAAKALFSIFLHHRLCSGLDDVAVLEAACSSGCNPHCHFLLLLQSVSFDHSILLDFLISTETCFLEYFVRYLKYLRADWTGFTAACGRSGSSDWRLSLQQSHTASGGGDRLEVTWKGEQDGAEVSSRVQPAGVTVRLAAGCHLVEYDSSDQSDPENMEVSLEEPGPSVREKSRFSALDVKQEIVGQKQCESSDSEPNSTLERRQEEGPSLPSGRAACETLARAVLCMSELREVVTRLQTKKLFPYNPSSLLKLLAQVENCA